MPWQVSIVPSTAARGYFRARAELPEALPIPFVCERDWLTEADLDRFAGIVESDYTRSLAEKAETAAKQSQLAVKVSEITLALVKLGLEK